ncbi:hypothetical protein IWQ61_001338 [Dispira simplex]|nr:hypothetical protein IWQ61_001338 [Dispira simplex]
MQEKLKVTSAAMFEVDTEKVIVHETKNSPSVNQFMVSVVLQAVIVQHSLRSIMMKLPLFLVITVLTVAISAEHDTGFNSGPTSKWGTFFKRRYPHRTDAEGDNDGSKPDLLQGDNNVLVRELCKNIYENAIMDNNGVERDKVQPYAMRRITDPFRNASEYYQLENAAGYIAKLIHEEKKKLKAAPHRTFTIEVHAKQATVHYSMDRNLNEPRYLNVRITHKDNTAKKAGELLEACEKLTSSS